MPCAPLFCGFGSSKPMFFFFFFNHRPLDLLNSTSLPIPTPPKESASESVEEKCRPHRTFLNGDLGSGQCNTWLSKLLESCPQPFLFSAVPLIHTATAVFTSLLLNRFQPFSDKLSRVPTPFSSFLLIEKNANFTPFLYIAVKALLFPLKHNFTSLHFKSVVLLSDKQGAPSRTDARKRRLKWPHHPDQERRRPLVTSHHRLSATQ